MSEALLKPISITQFTSFGQYLQAVFASLREESSSFSLEKFCRESGLKSKSVVSMYAQGKRFPSPKSLAKLGQYLHWTSQDLEFASLLIASERAGEAASHINYFTKRLDSLRPLSNDTKLINDHAALLSNWFTCSVHEMFHLKDFRADPTWISHRLGGTVTPRDVLIALETLEQLKLIARDDQIGWRLLEPYWEIPSGMPSKHIRSFHRMMLTRGARALEHDLIQDRFFVGQTVAIKESDLPEAKRFIDEMMDKFTKRFFCQDSDQVFHCAAHFFPLTTSLMETSDVK